MGDHGISMVARGTTIVARGIVMNDHGLHGRPRHSHGHPWHMAFPWGQYGIYMGDGGIATDDYAFP